MLPLLTNSYTKICITTRQRGMGSIVQMTHGWYKIVRLMLTFSEVPWLPFFLCQKMIFLWKFRGTPRTLFSCNDWSVETTWILGQTAWSLQINYIKAWEIWTSFTWSFQVCPIPMVNISLPTHAKQNKPCKLKQWRKLLRCHLEQVHPHSPVTDSYHSALTPNTWSWSEYLGEKSELTCKWVFEKEMHYLSVTAGDKVPVLMSSATHTQTSWGRENRVY